MKHLQMNYRGRIRKARKDWNIIDYYIRIEIYEHRFEDNFAKRRQIETDEITANIKQMLCY